MVSGPPKPKNAHLGVGWCGGLGSFGIRLAKGLTVGTNLQLCATHGPPSVPPGCNTGLA